MSRRAALAAAPAGRADLAQPLVQARPVARDVLAPARARAAPASAPARRPRGARGAAARPRAGGSAARASPQSAGTADSAACVGVEHDTAATSSISVRSVWWPTDAITGTRSIATVRHSVSSQNANRSASEPPPRATTITSTSSTAARSCSACVIRGAAWRSWTGANAQTSAAAQPRRRSPASTSSRALPPSPVTTPIVRGSTGRCSCFCGSNRPSAASALPQPIQLREQVALAGDAHARDLEGERRRRRAAAGVVVRAARDDDLGAVDDRVGGGPELLEVRAPHRARHRAVAVAQLEVDLCATAAAHVEDLAEQLHARDLAHPLL